MEQLDGETKDIDRRPSEDGRNDNGRRSGEKYGLRPRTAIKRLQQDLPLQEVVSRRSGRKSSKSRPAPLSKYRRKTANARERHRMKAINTAFESLRRVLPEAGAEVQQQHSSPSTMTKITTLRLAVDYIRALTDVLGDDEGDDDVGLSLKSERTDVVRRGTDKSSVFSEHLSPVSTSYTVTVPVSVRQTHHHHDHNDLSNMSSSSSSSTPIPLHYKDEVLLYKNEVRPQYQPHLTQLMSYCSASSDMSVSCSPSTSRGSLGSTSDLEELLSDDSGLLEDNLDVFHDIPTITLADPFEVLLEGEKEALHFPSGF